MTPFLLVAAALPVPGLFVQGVNSTAAGDDAVLLAEFVAAPTPSDEQAAQVDLKVRLRQKVAAGEITQAEAVARLRQLNQPRNTLITDPANNPESSAYRPTRETEGNQQTDTTRRSLGAARVRAGSATVSAAPSVPRR